MGAIGDPLFYLQFKSDLTDSLILFLEDPLGIYLIISVP